MPLFIDIDTCTCIYMHKYIFALLLISDPDCYQLVSMNRIYPTTKKMPVTKKQDVSKSSSTENVLM